jgi:DNA-binding GntR family transcriptional regulator
MDTMTSTQQIVTSLTKAIVEHRLVPGAKLVEQKLADHFGVSRTLIRQAFFQLERQRLIVLEPARGAFVASPSITEAGEVFAVRRMLEAGMVRSFVAQVSPAQIQVLREHVQAEKQSIAQDDAQGRVELLGDFHVCMAELMGNAVLAELLASLISRCALVTLMYQTAQAAQASNDDHALIVDALEKRDEARAVALMNAHLTQVFDNLHLDRKPAPINLNAALPTTVARSAKPSPSAKASKRRNKAVST